MREIMHVGHLFRTVEHSLMQEMRRNHESLELTGSQGFLLGYLTHRYLDGERNFYARDLEQYFSIRHSSISGVLQRLEAKGFITFEPDQNDRRCKKIVLTEKALLVHKQIETRISATESKLFGGMTDREVEEFVRLLKIAADNMGGEEQFHHFEAIEEDSTL